MKVYIEYPFVNGPWGGGNHFLSNIKKNFLKRGIICEKPEDADIILFNAHQNFQEVISLKQAYPDKVFIHRTDGIYKLYNDIKDERQDIVNYLNSEVADATIFQTQWAKDQHVNFGLKNENPFTIIGNACDTELFTNRPKSKSKKIKLICTSWSINKNKGFDYYEYLDKKLDFSKYSFTYVGNDPKINFKNIVKVPPLDRKDLAEELCKHDIFITGSKHECCSNSLLEALACGLPALGLNSGGTPEIIKDGGLLFSSEQHLIKQLSVLSTNISYYSSKIAVPTIKEISNQYILFFKNLLQL